MTGTLIISSDLQVRLCQGRFATQGKRYDLVACFAIEASQILPDQYGQPHRLAIKIFGAEWLHVVRDEMTGTQNFHFNNAPMLELTDIDNAIETFKLSAKYWDEPEGLKKELAKRPNARKKVARDMLPNTHILTQ